MTDKKEEQKDPKKQMEAFRKKVTKEDTKSTESIIKQIATRDKLERDYVEDLLEVSFFSSPETRRMVKAKRPTQEQMMTIMKLSAEAAIYEGKMDPKSLSKMVDIYEKLPELASSLCTDSKLNKEFWTKRVSFATLQNFITELIKETQQGTGPTPEDMDSFR